MTSPNMGLTIPTPTVTPGPQYATNIAGDLTIIDQHNHSTGNGAPIANNTYLGMAQQASDPLAGVTSQGGVYIDTNGNLNYHNPVTDASTQVTGLTALASAQSHKTSTQVVPNNTLTTVTYPSITHNTGGCLDSGGDTFTAPTTADYLVSAQICISSTGADYTGTTTLSIYVAGSSVADSIINNELLYSGSGVVPFTIAVSTTINVLSGQTIQIKMITTSGYQYTISATGRQSIVSFKQLP